MANIRSFKELRVWQNAMDLAMAVFEITKRFPPTERYSMTDQFRRGIPLGRRERIGVMEKTSIFGRVCGKA